MKLPVDEQIAALKKTGSVRFLSLMKFVAVLITTGLVIIGISIRHPAFYAAAAVAGIVTLAVSMTVPHVLNAARGLDEGWKQGGIVEITICEWTDEEMKKTISCQGLIFMDNQALWRMEFAMPENWQPVEGRYKTDLVFIRGVEWPVLLLMEGGLLYPRLKPTRIPGVNSLSKSQSKRIT